jgi:hypothetical protein
VTDLKPIVLVIDNRISGGTKGILISQNVTGFELYEYIGELVAKNPINLVLKCKKSKNKDSFVIGQIFANSIRSLEIAPMSVLTLEESKNSILFEEEKEIPNIKKNDLKLRRNKPEIRIQTDEPEASEDEMVQMAMAESLRDQTSASGHTETERRVLVNPSIVENDKQQRPKTPSTGKILAINNSKGESTPTRRAKRRQGKGNGQQKQKNYQDLAVLIQHHLSNSSCLI